MKHLIRSLEHYRYDFKYIDLPRITYWTAEKIVNAYREGKKEVEVTLDLGLSKEKVVIDGSYVSFRNKFWVKIDLLKDLYKDRVYEIVDDDKIVELSIRGKHMYKLRPVAEDIAPTLEIDGIHMHRIVGITPWEDSRRKVQALKIRRGDVVLDTCMGLGYTAIHALLMGAAIVYTIEIDENVIELARHNPWSRFLEDPRIVTLKGDTTVLVNIFPVGTFDKIIHDPPRLTKRYGNLYSNNFYSRLCMLLKDKGYMFHYVGKPRTQKHSQIISKIGGRLKRSGFHQVYYVENAMGFVAEKYIGHLIV